MLYTDIQRALNRAGNYGLKEDGFVGPKTRKATKDFQAKHNLIPDGKVGPLTEAVLAKYLAGSASVDTTLKTPPNGKLRFVDTVIVHCTASAFGVPLTVAQIRAMHKAQGWSDIGYHYVVLLNGKLAPGRPEALIGAHVSGHNTGSLGISYVGGLDKAGRPADTRTPEQKATLIQAISDFVSRYPIRRIAGHRDFSPDLNGNGTVEPREWIKACPCFDAEPEYKRLLVR